LLKDTDGKFHLNYFGEMRRHASNAPLTTKMAMEWKRAHMATIDAAIASADSARKMATTAQARTAAFKIRRKWTWFKEQFEMATTDIVL
jgi:hypothetical protein